MSLRVMSLSGIWRAFARESGGNIAIIAAFALVPILGMTGAAVDFGMAIYARQKLDAAVQSAVAAAIAQGRALRAGRSDVPDGDLEARGRSRADLVFNAQKPSVRNVRTTFSLTRSTVPNTYDVNIDYEASIGTVFLRLVGASELNVRGSASASWLARDTIFEERFEDYERDVLAGGSRSLPALAGWATNGARGSAAALRLAPADLSGVAPAPADVRVALEMDTGAGNAFISRKFSVEPGQHQIRYWYRDRAPNPLVAPGWLCGTRLEDVDWMKGRDSDASSDTSVVSVYLTADVTNAPPVEAALTASSRIDACYNSGSRWIQRVVKIDVAVRGDYWLTFQAGGRVDSIGGAVANIVVCRDPCTQDDGSARQGVDNLPWNRDQLLFEDNFTSSGANPIAVSPSRDGAWSALPAGWTVAPMNAVVYARDEATGEGYVSLDAPMAAGGFGNRLMTRSFFFVPGHYSLRYVYAVGVSQTGRGLCNYYGLPRDPALSAAGPTDPYSNLVAAFIDPDLSILHPEPTGGGTSTAPAWFNARGQRDTAISGPLPPSLPRAAVDFCVDMPDGVRASREVNFNIVRAGYYWISFSGGGAADGQGGRIAKVQILLRDSRDQPLWRTVKDGSDPAVPEIASWIAMPSGSAARALYRVQAQ